MLFDNNQYLAIIGPGKVYSTILSSAVNELI
jgi:hypothetical protein